METNKTIPAGLDTLNDSQRTTAEDLLSKVEKALRSNVEVEMEDRIFSIKGAARSWQELSYNSACSRVKEHC